MSNGTRVCFAVAHAICLFSIAAGAQELTEREAVRRFIAQSPHHRDLRAGVAATRAETQTWSLRPNPRASYSHEGAGLTEIMQVEQPLFISGRLGLMRQAGIAAVHVAESKSRYTLWEITSDLRLAFYRFVLEREREKSIRQSLNELQEAIRILRERETEGEGSAFDRLRAEREQTDLQAELSSAQVNSVQARSQLASFLSLDATGSLSVQGALQNHADLPPLPEVTALALRARSDYQAEQQQAEQWQLQKLAANRLRIPEPVFSAGVKRASVARGTEYGPYIAISVPLPIFNRGQGEVARFQALAEQTQARSDVLKQRLEAEIAGAYATVKLRRQVAAEYLREMNSQGAQLSQIAKLAYREGEVGILELLDAFRTTRQAQLRAVELNGAAKQAEIELERVVGEPLLTEELREVWQ